LTSPRDFIPATIPSNRRAAAAIKSGRRLGELLGIPHDNHEAKTHAFPLTKVVIRASIVADCAVTELEEHYANASACAMDVTHTIPLPADGAVTAFEIVSGGRVSKGRCKQKDEARSDFESARKRGKTAAIIESERDDVHTISLANVPAKADVIVRMRIVERLRVDDGRFEYRFPTVISPKFAPGDAVSHKGSGTAPDTLRAPDASRLTPPVKLGGGTLLDLEIQVAAGATDISSSVRLGRSQGPDGTIVLRPDKASTCRRDIVLRAWSRTAEPVVRAYTDGERTLVVVDPPAHRRPELERPREAVFVLDRSGSMQGKRLRAARRALATALEGLSEGDTFEIVAFNLEVERFDQEPVRATKPNIERALRWLESVKADGGTDAVAALEHACLGRVAAGRVRTVLFLTDGDVANDAEILALSRRFDPAMRLFSVGIGEAPSMALLSRLARLGGGTALFVADSQNIEGEIRRFESTFVGPIASGLGIAGARRHSGRDLFAGRSTTFFIEGAPDVVDIVSVDQRFSGRAMVARAPIALGALWARERVTMLEDQLAANPDQQGIIDAEIAELGVLHQIQTRLTSFVAVDEQSQVDGEPVVIVQPTDGVDDGDDDDDDDGTAFGSYMRPAMSLRRGPSPSTPNQSTPQQSAPVRRALFQQPPEARFELHVSTAIIVAELQLAKFDPSQPMTLRIAFFVLLASLERGHAVAEDLIARAVRFIGEDAGGAQSADAARVGKLNEILDAHRRGERAQTVRLIMEVMQVARGKDLWPSDDRAITKP
jgi:Ca-activated chloride channel family protein